MNTREQELEARVAVLEKELQQCQEESARILTMARRWRKAYRDGVLEPLPVGCPVDLPKEKQ